jgi:hypothetical protein
MHNREEAIAKILESWNGIEMSVINGLCLSFNHRVQMTIDVRGKTIPLFSPQIGLLSPMNTFLIGKTSSPHRPGNP